MDKTEDAAGIVVQDTRPDSLTPPLRRDGSCRETRVPVGGAGSAAPLPRRPAAGHIEPAGLGLLTVGWSIQGHRLTDSIPKTNTQQVWTNSQVPGAPAGTSSTWLCQLCILQRAA